MKDNFYNIFNIGDKLNKYYKEYKTCTNKNIVIHNTPTFNKKSKLLQIKNMGTFKNKLDRYTYNLLSHITLSDNVVLSGGVLYNLLFEEEISMNKFVDIDIFVIKNKSNKLPYSFKFESDYIENLLSSLTSKNLKCYCYVKDSVFYIFIDDIPRMLQIVFVDVDDYYDLMNNSDTSHTAMIYDGNNVIASGLLLHGLIKDKSYFCRGNTLFRMHKILSKNLYVHLIDKPIKKMISPVSNHYDKIDRYYDCVLDSEYDYNEILNNKEVKLNLEKEYFVNFENFDTLSRLYNFDKNKIFTFHGKLDKKKVLDYIYGYYNDDYHIDFYFEYKINKDNSDLGLVNLNLNSNLELVNPNYLGTNFYVNELWKLPITLYNRYNSEYSNVCIKNHAIITNFKKTDEEYFNFKNLYNDILQFIDMINNDEKINKGYKFIIEETIYWSPGNISGTFNYFEKYAFGIALEDKMVSKISDVIYKNKGGSMEIQSSVFLLLKFTNNEGLINVGTIDVLISC